MNIRIKPAARFILQLFPSSHYAILSLFMFIGLELLFMVHRWLFILLAILLGILTIGIILIRKEEGELFHPTQTILPTLAAFGFAAFAIYLPLTFFIHIYFVACAIIFFLILRYGAKQAWPTWNVLISLFVLFATIAPVIGWRFNLYTPVWSMLALLFPIIALVSFQSLLRYAPTIPQAVLISGVLALTLTQAAWVLQFMPFHFVVQAGFIVALYYVAFQLIALVYERTFTTKAILEYGAIGIIAIAILLGTAAWS